MSNTPKNSQIKRQTTPVLDQRHSQKKLHSFQQAFGSLKGTDLDSDAYWEPILERSALREVPDLD